MFKLCIVLIALIGIVLCEDCDYKGLKIKAGEDGYPKGECIKVHCISANQISALPCPQIGIPAGCKVNYKGEDLSKKYPECCPKAYCD